MTGAIPNTTLKFSQEFLWQYYVKKDLCLLVLFRILMGQLLTFPCWAVHLSYMDIMSSYILSISSLLRDFYEVMLNFYTIMKNPRIN